MEGFALPPTARTGEGLRDVLFDEIDRLRAGTGDRRRAMVIVELARQIIKVAWLEIEFARVAPADGPPNAIMKVPTIKLGNEIDDDAPAVAD